MSPSSPCHRARPLLAVYQSLCSVERDGYRVWIDDDEDVRVEPHDLHADVSFVLVSNADDLAAILADQRVH